MTTTHHKRATRVEVIDQSGRAYVNTNCRDVAVSIQDDGRTIKVFLRTEEEAA